MTCCRWLGHTSFSIKLVCSRRDIGQAPTAVIVNTSFANPCPSPYRTKTFIALRTAAQRVPHLSSNPPAPCHILTCTWCTQLGATNHEQFWKLSLPPLSIASKMFSCLSMCFRFLRNSWRRHHLLQFHAPFRSFWLGLLLRMRRNTQQKLEQLLGALFCIEDAVSHFRNESPCSPSSVQHHCSHLTETLPQKDTDHTIRLFMCNSFSSAYTETIDLP